MSPLNLKILWLSDFEKIGGTASATDGQRDGRTDGRGVTLNAAATDWHHNHNNVYIASNALSQTGVYELHRHRQRVEKRLVCSFVELSLWSAGCCFCYRRKLLISSMTETATAQLVVKAPNYSDIIQVSSLAASSSLQISNRSVRYYVSPDLWNQLLLHSVNLILFTVLLVYLFLRISPHHSHHPRSHHLSLYWPFTADLKLIGSTSLFP